MKRWFLSRRFGGILWHFVFAGLFIGLSLFLLGVLKGVTWYLVSSALRVLSGIGILAVCRRLFGQDWRDILSLCGAKDALLAGSGFLLFFVYYVVTVVSGFGGITGLTPGIFLSRVLLQQIATGFYEELNYRYLLLQGGRQTGKRPGMKLLLVLGSAVLFGLLHCVTGWSTYTFLQTGVLGFAFAVIFFVSGNLVIPMLLHFLYDVIANLAPFVTWNHTALFDGLNAAFEIMLAGMCMVSLVILVLNIRKTARPSV